MLLLRQHIHHKATVPRKLQLIRNNRLRKPQITSGLHKDISRLIPTRKLRINLVGKHMHLRLVATRATRLHLHL